VEGVRAWQERGLRAPEAVTEATDAYRQDSDLLAAFLAERCTVSSDAWTTKRELFKAFTTWADESGESPMSKRVFGERLQERDGITEGRDGTRGRYWSGIGLLNQVTQ
jgi:putative DNA primase/helicase